MSEKQLIQQFKELPFEARQEAANFIDFLYKKYIRKEAFPKKESSQIVTRAKKLKKNAKGNFSIEQIQNAIDHGRP